MNNFEIIQFLCGNSSLLKSQELSFIFVRFGSLLHVTTQLQYQMTIL